MIDTLSTQLKCTIEISKNRLMGDEKRDNSMFPIWIIENQICPLITFEYTSKRGKTLIVSSFRVNDNYIFYPLWHRDGHTRIEIPVSEYNRLIRGAEIVSSLWGEVSGELLRSLDTEIRAHFLLE